MLIVAEIKRSCPCHQESSNLALLDSWWKAGIIGDQAHALLFTGKDV